MNSIKRWWLRVSGKLSLDSTETVDVTSRELCRMLRQCPVCRGNFTQHFYALFAMTVIDDDCRKRVREFFDACDDRDWQGARMFQEFDADRDAVVAYVMRCETGRIALMLELSPYEYYESDRVFACDVLDDETGRELHRHIAQSNWRRLSWT
ncbi:MAG: hypothetical protein L0226_13250 [Acidobacteria bacterium]|nr:hypothetical protein [Acidobacteriota bacterium]